MVPNWKQAWIENSPRVVVSNSVGGWSMGSALNFLAMPLGETY